MYRRGEREIEVLLVHPGGPFFKNKDRGAWSIPKGMIEQVEENLLSRAKIEFEEELGAPVTGDRFTELGWVKQKGGKTVHAWAFKGDFSAALKSNTYKCEWPPRSGQWCDFPEVDDAQWFPLDIARSKINAAQIAFLDRLSEAVAK